MKKLLFIVSNFMLFVSFLVANPLEFKTLSSDFTQTVKNDGSMINYSGNFQATNTHALWKYRSPSPKDIYFSFERVVVIEPDLEQAILTTLKDVPNLTKVMQNAKKIDENLYDAKFDDILYHLKFKNDLINTITYTDKLGNEVEINFSNVKKNINLNDAIFMPQIPANFDIITQ
ncbi:LolA-like outer membrane lipoprotein chaperone [Campylobacter corcagiensis]|uniref:Outer membrane lipoprotein chaperone LolA n=1 Tax=Campylobacter corcagiensis TaxID=1448857 RepID=A0A7M1LEP4_9BACT|nr:LolA-like outer membrane lipoprotein chaperone [Campylobacter corcagiensis]QKF65037.1 periplasmic outer membrane-specific lipoprotein chaperone [Campylobacter corcagiensis]QOQ86811.1 outer membrane lipoprotein chaperone LolA [Campylobacter corcagiensis]